MSLTTSASVCTRATRHSFKAYHRIAATLVSNTLHSSDTQKLLLMSSSPKRTFVQSRPFTTRPHPTVDKVIRVDHAGEYGADRIYAGQAAVLGKTEVGHVIEVMSCVYSSVKPVYSSYTTSHYKQIASVNSQTIYCVLRMGPVACTGSSVLQWQTYIKI